MTIEHEMRALMAQTVLPGARKATDATLAQRGCDAPLRPKTHQRPANELGDLPLFGDSHKQIEMFK